MVRDLPLADRLARMCLAATEYPPETRVLIAQHVACAVESGCDGVSPT